MVYILLITAILLFLSVVSSKISSFLGIPSLLLFILLGILAGSEGIGHVYFDDPLLTQYVGVLALSLILFAGGLSIDWKELRRALVGGVSLATVAVLVTATIMGTFAHYFLGFSWLEGLLLGSVISSTDAAAVFGILRSKNINLKGNLRHLLEFESGSNDPMAVFLTIACLSLITGKTQTYALLIPVFIMQLAIGLIVGYVVGHLLILLINNLKLQYDGLYPVLTASGVLFAYSAASLLGGNGFLAVYFAGLVMGARLFLHKKYLIRFHDGLAWFMQVSIFLVLGLLVFISLLKKVIISGILAALFLIFVARPLSVFISLAFTRFKLREKLMISWVGLRGAAPIILATFPLTAGISNAQVIFDIVFFVVILSVLIQGTTVPMVAKLLKVTAPLRPAPKYPLEFEITDTLSSEFVEIVVPEDSPAVGKEIKDLNLPASSLILVVMHDNKFIIPQGETTINKQDMILLLADKSDISAIRSTFKID
ncbi:MAG TPA: potassium/proton antiporter [Candidatus Margulisbacteria bacterium]|nr:MAG: K+/H+ antiporter [Candidatus Margulisbacteria bacterium GWD2_39_127]OGI02675.1 MAG: K+/H+ antiporter [Candidatus Margulisbacteria bacterium GWF2_38_17]OGI05940.1 MAG: K+/H+ antiporter [Candidatus Margulisbacteria bacterium GWE2_39_32]HAR62589.1 potassium/proton antiporter [Candidatus Margulisiibacteriota bacterium]HCT84736.1 potassium/proton antiporter [Candidatus Margulisiibacteriota bacterium]